jgi:hypothetical protein
MTPENASPCRRSAATSSPAGGDRSVVARARTMSVRITAIRVADARSAQAQARIMPPGNSITGSPGCWRAAPCSNLLGAALTRSDVSQCWHREAAGSWSREPADEFPATARCESTARSHARRRRAAAARCTPRTDALRRDAHRRWRRPHREEHVVIARPCISPRGEAHGAAADGMPWFAPSDIHYPE